VLLRHGYTRNIGFISMSSPAALTIAAGALDAKVKAIVNACKCRQRTPETILINKCLTVIRN
jgi:hypothetical protein